MSTAHQKAHARKMLVKRNHPEPSMIKKPAAAKKPVKSEEPVKEETVEQEAVVEKSKTAATKKATKKVEDDTVNQEG